MSRPRLLDLFCGAGGAAMGYHRAGFDVVGVDIKPQPRYPFTFIQADAMSFPLGGFDAIHASPPCQDYSRAMSHLTTRDYPRLIEPMRGRLAGLPWWVIENVPGAPLPVQSTLDGAHGVELCGSMFGRPLWRHRLFETSWSISAPRGCDHSSQPTNRNRSKRPGGRSSNRAWREAIGVTWMTTKECDESIPPAYTEYIGRQLLEQISEPSPAAREICYEWATFSGLNSTPGRSDPPVKPTSEVAHQPGQQPAAARTPTRGSAQSRDVRVCAIDPRPAPGADLTGALLPRPPERTARGGQAHWRDPGHPLRPRLCGGVQRGETKSAGQTTGGARGGSLTSWATYAQIGLT